jgi:cold-inducible RNA-binding protein
MGSKLFVGNLSFNTTDDGLMAAFSPFGNVISAKIITDRDSGRSRGFGFVQFEDAGTADEAMGVMNGTELDGREIRVDMAQERQRGGGGGGRRNTGNYRDDDRGGRRGNRRGNDRGRRERR